MKINTVTYQKAFVIGPYLQEKIGVEVELGPNDEADEAFRQAQSIVNHWHKDANPHLENPAPGQQGPPIGELPVINRAHERLKELIADAVNIETLQVYKDSVYNTNNSTLINLYMNKYASLSKHQ